MIKNIITGIVVSIFLLVGLVVIQKPNVTALGGGTSLANPKCTVGSTLKAEITTTSGTVLAANSNRAWARLSTPRNATNTIALSFNHGAAAVMDHGILLNATSSSIVTMYIDFGRSTDFPYVGAVTGITNLGASNVLITECSY